MSENHEKIRISQVLAGALAAVSAAVLGSTMGVAGTVVDAGRQRGEHPARRTGRGPAVWGSPVTRSAARRWSVLNSGERAPVVLGNHGRGDPHGQRQMGAEPNDLLRGRIFGCHPVGASDPTEE
jgi:hypothetical protein